MLRWMEAFQRNGPRIRILKQGKRDNVFPSLRSATVPSGAESVPSSSAEGMGILV